MEVETGFAGEGHMCTCGKCTWRSGNIHGKQVEETLGFLQWLTEVAQVPEFESSIP